MTYPFAEVVHESEGPYKVILQSGYDLIVSSESPETVVIFNGCGVGIEFEDVCLKIANKAYAAGFKAGLERAAVIAGRQTGWVAGTIQEDIREDLEKL